MARKKQEPLPPLPYSQDVLSCLLQDQPTIHSVEIPKELEEELDRHSKKSLKHFLAGKRDDCKSCCIHRGIRKLIVMQGLVPLIEQSLAMMEEISQSSTLVLFMKDVRKFYDDNVNRLYKELGLDPNDSAANALAFERNAKDIRAVFDTFRKYGVSP